MRVRTENNLGSTTAAFKLVAISAMFALAAMVTLGATPNAAAATDISSIIIVSMDTCSNVNAAMLDNVAITANNEEATAIAAPCDVGQITAENSAGYADMGAESEGTAYANSAAFILTANDAAIRVSNAYYETNQPVFAIDTSGAYNAANFFDTGPTNGMVYAAAMFPAGIRGSTATNNGASGTAFLASSAAYTCGSPLMEAGLSTEAKGFNAANIQAANRGNPATIVIANPKINTQVAGTTYA